MKLSLSTGLAAGILALSAGPALAAPANVTVRVEGASVTRVASVRVATTAAPVAKAGHDCSGTSAGGALDRATGGDWDAGYFDGLGHFVSTIKGETPSGDDYWSVWVNHGATSAGACATELQEGDEVLFFVDRCTYDGTGCSNAPVEPLALTAPASATVGVPGEVGVVRYDAAKTAHPVAGAKVTGPGIDATTGADGKATVIFPAAGTVRLQATKPGLVRSETHDVVVAPAGAAPRTPDAPPLTVAAPDRTAPTAKLAGLKDHQILRRGPRELRGSFGADPSGLRTVKLRLTKRVGKKCWYFSGKQERFRGTRCGRGSYFGIGDRADWSYLLPAQLGPGRYVLDAIAIDGAGNRTPIKRDSTRVVFTVR
jgi:hypothetical protein